MNDFFNKIEAAAKRVASNVSSEVSIAAEEQKLRESYQILGKLFYQAKANGLEPNSPDINDCCKKIAAALECIETLKQVNDVTGEAPKA